ncbi:MAG: hypothetical protein QW356_08480 [Candidatus Hadarchaeales archaeon]
MDREALDRWLSKVLPELPPERREVLERYVWHMKLSNFSPWTIKANVQAVLTLPGEKPY